MRIGLVTTLAAMLATTSSGATAGDQRASLRMTISPVQATVKSQANIPIRLDLENVSAEILRVPMDLQPGLGSSYAFRIRRDGRLVPRKPFPWERPDLSREGRENSLEVANASCCRMTMDEFGPGTKVNTIVIANELYDMTLPGTYEVQFVQEAGVLAPISPMDGEDRMEEERNHRDGEREGRHKRKHEGHGDDDRGVLAKSNVITIVVTP